MTTLSHGDQPLWPVAPYDQLYQALAALEGLGELLDPDPQLDERSLANVAFLVQVLTTTFRSHLDAAMEERFALRRALDRVRHDQEVQP